MGRVAPFVRVFEGAVVLADGWWRSLALCSHLQVLLCPLSLLSVPTFCPYPLCPAWTQAWARLALPVWAELQKGSACPGGTAGLLFAPAAQWLLQVGHRTQSFPPLCACVPYAVNGKNIPFTNNIPEDVWRWKFKYNWSIWMSRSESVCLVKKTKLYLDPNLCIWWKCA